MTIGEKIQFYRKQLGLSQEELGQKLLVSRQTISLWEKDQTLPTIDNLIRLKSVSGVSVDAILSTAENERAFQELPDESYRFNFTKTELDEIYRLQRKEFFKKPLRFFLILVCAIVFYILSSKQYDAASFGFGILFISSIIYARSFQSFTKSQKNGIDQICASTYEYNIFERYIEIGIYRENEKIRESKCYYTDIEKIKQLDKWLLLQIGGQIFIVRKNDLKNNSAFYSYMYKNPSKTVGTPMPEKFRVTSILLFVSSLLSILCAIVLVGAITDINGLFTENMWIFFLMTPIPISSFVFGLVLKSKGYKYKKNVIAGIIMTFLLCVYGSFVFIF